MESSVQMQEDLLRKARERFIAERLKQEMEVQAWGEKIKQCDPSILEGIELPEEISLKTLLPELYVDRPNQSVYDEQYEKMQELFDKCNKVAEEYNAKVRKTIEEYEVFIS